MEIEFNYQASIRCGKCKLRHHYSPDPNWADESDVEDHFSDEGWEDHAEFGQICPDCLQDEEEEERIASEIEDEDKEEDDDA